MIELLSQENNISYNVRVADIFGLNSAVLISILITEHHRVKLSGKERQDKYISLSRDDIFDKMFIDDSKQIEIEDNLISCNILHRKDFRNNDRKKYYYLDIDMLSKVLSIEDGSKREEFFKKSNTKIVSKEKPMSKRQAMILNIKKGLQSEVDKELYPYVCEWVDEVWGKGKYLSKRGVLINLEEISRFDKRVQIEILQTLAKKAWTDNKYALEYMNKFGNKLVMNNSTRETADVEQVKEKINKGVEGVDYF